MCLLTLERHASVSGGPTILSTGVTSACTFQNNLNMFILFPLIEVTAWSFHLLRCPKKNDRGSLRKY